MARFAERLLTPALDAATLLAAWWLLPLLAAQLGRESEVNLAILIGAHLLMCVAVAAAKLIQPQPKAAVAEKGGKEDSPASASQATLLGLSLPFSIALIAMLVACGRLLDETSTGGAWFALAAGEGNALTSLSLILAFILLLSVFPSAVLYTPKACITSGTPAYWLVRAGSLLAVNAMVLVTAAFWDGYLASGEPMEASLSLRILLTLVLYPLFLLFFAAPRLALLSLEPGRWTLAGFHMMLVVYVWQLTA